MSAVAFVVGVLVMLVGLAVSIAIHEFGHLIPAKLFGVRVGQYMIGFGPTIWKRRIGETEYGFRWLPLGGFISMAGMYPPSRRLRDRERVAAETSTGGRAPGRMFRAMVQDAQDANDETLADGTDRTFYRLSVWQRLVVMVGGPLGNLLLAIVLFAVLASGIGIQAGSTTVSAVSECVHSSQMVSADCGPGDPVSPAAAAGFQPGDEIVAIDGTEVATFEEASAIIRSAPQQQLAVDVLRDGEAQTLRLTPMLATRQAVDANGSAVTGTDGEPVLEGVGFAGISPVMAYERQPIWSGPQLVFEHLSQVAVTLVQLPVKIAETAATLFTGDERDPNGPLSIVGVGAIAGEVAASETPILSRISVIIALLGGLNIALFAFNLIPLLPLDGGHIVVALWDGIRRWWAKLRGRPEPEPVDATRLVPITFVVVIALVGMGALLILADILNPMQVL